jgi:hypothetical protein
MHGTEIGRNDTCRCGSGKKFKKCCINKPYQPSPELLADLALGQKRVKEAGEVWAKEEPPRKRMTIGLHAFAALAAGTMVDDRDWREMIDNR